MLLHIAAAAAVSCVTDWNPYPDNSGDYPLWPYCDRRPGEYAVAAYDYMESTTPPATQPAYTCPAGTVLRHDASALVCLDRNVGGDGNAGACTAAQCCTGAVCGDFTCPAGWVDRPEKPLRSCYEACTREVCCTKATLPSPPQGLHFVDVDARAGHLSGRATIRRAADETDVVGYRVYWGYVKIVRRAPPCNGSTTPVAWESHKWADQNKVLAEVSSTGCDVAFDIPTGTSLEALPRDSCDLNAPTADCYPRYLMVVSFNSAGEESELGDLFFDLLQGPKHQVVDYDGDAFADVPCAEVGVSYGGEMPSANEATLGTWNGVFTALECQNLCRQHGTCRYWTWVPDTAGTTTRNSCWMEVDTLQKRYVATRIAGPAACPTPPGSGTTGIEKPKCARWERLQNTAPFASGGRNAFEAQGRAVVQQDVSFLGAGAMGPYASAEDCFFHCDADPLCVGVIWTKRGTFDPWYHTCAVLRQDDGGRYADPAHDLWLCSREGQAPMLNGFSLAPRPYGYMRCVGPTVIFTTELSYSACADRCDRYAACAGFTFATSSGLCELSEDCSSMVPVDDVAGCDAISCFDGYGAATYIREQVRTATIVDRWPHNGSPATGLAVRVETNGMLDGITITCAAAMDGLHFTMAPSTAPTSASGIVVGDVAAMTLEATVDGYTLEHAKDYLVTCTPAYPTPVPLSLTAVALPVIPSQSLRLEAPPGYTTVGDGVCQTRFGCVNTNTIPPFSGKPYTAAQCKTLCNANPDCGAFSWRESDGWCRMEHDECDYFRVSPVTGDRATCFQRVGVLPHVEPEAGVDGGMCPRDCGTADPCVFARDRGVYESNMLYPSRLPFLLDDDCGAYPCGEVPPQWCEDLSPASPTINGDYLCTCGLEPRTIGYWAPHPNCSMALDECTLLPYPCGDLANTSCYDHNASHASYFDYSCACVADANINVTAQPVNCYVDECALAPCGNVAVTNMTCNDTRTTPTSLNDYTCTCTTDPTSYRIADTLVCYMDECAAQPCGGTPAQTNQTCYDPQPLPNRILDFVCRCTTDPSIARTAAPAVCYQDECIGAPCGAVNQTCYDPVPVPTTTGDWVCTCTTDPSLQTVAAPAVCYLNECFAGPCGFDGQTCYEPNPLPNFLMDYTCTCNADPSISALAAPAVCYADECAATPCGDPAVQMCNDPNVVISSSGDYVCSCLEDYGLQAVGMPAVCTIDECMGDPCNAGVPPNPGGGQTCIDANTLASRLNDFTCRCVDVPTLLAVARPAGCWRDECSDPSSPPCPGVNQTCSDPGPYPNSLDDWLCTCVRDTSVFAVAMNIDCYVNECLDAPCGGTAANQTCSDPNTFPNSLGDYVCTCVVDPTIRSTGAPAWCYMNECDAAPCTAAGGPNAMQTCYDPVPTPTTTNDFYCTCVEDPSIVNSGAPALCYWNECDAGPCGAGQVCEDPAAVPTSLEDYTCTCAEAPSVTATGGAVVCYVDECAAGPCGADEICYEPNTLVISSGDFTCTCGADASIVATGAPAACVYDECAQMPPPCGADQTCRDDYPVTNRVNDYTCTCDANTDIVARGAAAICDDDECSGNPCPSVYEACNDPMPFPTTRGDFTCTCRDDQALRVVGGPVVCVVDECAPRPCGSVNQTCADPNTHPNSLDDFTCTCTTDPSISAAAGAVPSCWYDECTGAPCGGVNQTCYDPAPFPPSMGDFVCTCTAYPSMYVTGAPALCYYDECMTVPCGSDGEQTCSDADPKPTERGGYTCTCVADTAIAATGAPAVCRVDECAVRPCGDAAVQTCRDADTIASRRGDYVCTCVEDFGIANTGAPAVCYVDECAAMPCGTSGEQTCMDDNRLANRLRDFTCTCSSDPANYVVGEPAVCYLNECDDAPCIGGNQTCEDPSPSPLSRGDFKCVCVQDAAYFNTGGAIDCYHDECDERPCSAADPIHVQACHDPNTLPGNVNDYTCTCRSDAGIVSVAAPATCHLDECAANPCGVGTNQTCYDPVPVPTSTGDYFCTCTADPTLQAEGGPAVCYWDECAVAPCGSPNQICMEPTPYPNQLRDYTCTCVADGSVTATAAPAVCYHNECDELPCGAAGQICEDRNSVSTSAGDFSCTCAADRGIAAIGGPADCDYDECAALAPCGPAQTCDDPNPITSRLLDYTCTCDAYNDIVAVGDAAICYDNECDAAPCGTAGDQVCNDPMPTPGSRGDYTCACRGNAGLAATAGPVECYRDECAATPSPCGAAPNQTCSDPNPSPTALGDWTCTCNYDTSITATAAPVVCYEDECRALPCGIGLNQTCYDPVPLPTSTGDYFCTCTADASLYRLAAPTVCYLDECAAGPCGTDGKQTCRDAYPMPNKVGDYVCTCVEDAGITATGGGATCYINECAAAPCGVKQICVDADRLASSRGDYQCSCEEDLAVYSVGGPAACTWDECVDSPSPPCGTGQTCSDPDPLSSRRWDFTCTCDDDATIVATASPAVCAVDECERAPCGGANQSCTDPDHRPLSRFDFICTCDADASVRATGEPALCYRDECGAAPCDGAGPQNQTCDDPDTFVTAAADYVCRCVGDPSITATGGPAACYVNECDAAPCGSTLQSCRDPNTFATALGDFICACVEDASVEAIAAPAVCYANECDANPCGTGSQACEDRNALVTSAGDWVCTCIEDITIYAVAAPATCYVDECAVAPCGAEPGSNQTCEDRNMLASRLNDFVCSCKNDAAISAVGAPVVCYVDECTAGGVCGADASCTDINTHPQQTGDYRCTCDADPSIVSVGAPAVCFVDECAGTAAVCGGKQSCRDPDTLASASGDFECVCDDAPSVIAVGTPAVCYVDECAAGPCGLEECADPDHLVLSAGDYVCRCRNDRGVTAVGERVVCTLDECVENPCDDGLSQQRCADPTALPSKTGDFVCSCARDANITAVGRPAACYYDECGTSPCGAAAEQTCMDINTLPNRRYDYLCACVVDETLSAVGKPAVCAYDECADYPCGSVYANQTCVDPDPHPGVRLDYECRCRDAPSVLSVGAAAVCYINECMTDPCGPAQTCRDDGVLATQLGSFTCTCDSDGTTLAVAGPVATCSIDDCAARPCGDGQTCTDPDPTPANLNDYICRCDVDPNIYAEQAPAVCFLDECAAYERPCPEDQSCRDPVATPASLNDFICKCRSDGGTSTVGQPAVCEYDECTAEPGACGADQTCEDVDTRFSSRGDWVCTCTANGEVRTVGAPAYCVWTVDECASSPCGGDQTCADPKPTSESRGDFTCTCDDDAATATTGTTAVCVVDECADPMACRPADPSTYLGTQTCSDPDTRFSAQGDYVCTCDVDATITAVGAPVRCVLDECREEVASDGGGGGGVCGTGQTCLDPEPRPNSLRDYICSCADDLPTSSVGAPVGRCAVDECVDNQVPPCGAYQKCSDPDARASATGDYVCTCHTNPLIKNTGAPAVCVLDECKVRPCGVQQRCSDPKPNPLDIGDYMCICIDDPPTFAVGGPAVCVHDDCAVGLPCGDPTVQTCRDAEPVFSGKGEFVCECNVNPAVAALHGPADCNYLGDECVTTAPCGAGQLCSDPTPNAEAFGDFICTCEVDPDAAAVGSPVADELCAYDECARIGICGPEQAVACEDPNTSYASLGDYVCSCIHTELGTGVAIARPLLTCPIVRDECDTLPCGADQTCRDPVPSLSSIGDFECKCVDDPAMIRVGGAVPTCAYDECFDYDATTAPPPCGRVQNCVDRDMRFAKRYDYECSCAGFPDVTAVGAPVSRCQIDECDARPCDAPRGAAQTCVDPDTSPLRLNDFVCTCDADPATSVAGAPAVCSFDECAAAGVCGAADRVSCFDPDRRYSARGDYECRCLATRSKTNILVGGGEGEGDATTAAPARPPAVVIGAPIICEIPGAPYECDAAPCAAGQLCNDPTPAAGDFVCSCEGRAAAAAVGRSATCAVDECVVSVDTGYTPCGAGQTCVDPDTAAAGDYICSCAGATAGSVGDGGLGSEAVGRPAVCAFDECATTAEITTASATTTTTVSPCAATAGDGSVLTQLCSDPVPTAYSLNDFECRCPFDPSIVAVGAAVTAAECQAASADECDASPCAAGQLCVDQTPLDPDATGDFVCICIGKYEVSAVGAAADCEGPSRADFYDECLAAAYPCGAGQTCGDPVTLTTSLGDFACTCTNDATVRAVGAPATACVWDECGSPVCADGEACVDANTSFASRGDYTCRCGGSGVAGAIPALGSACYLDECVSFDSCGYTQACSDPMPSVLHRGDFTCRCYSDAELVNVGAPAVCERDECDAGPCGADQRCRDLDRRTRSVLNFECRCAPPFEGEATVGAEAVCSLPYQPTGVPSTYRPPTYAPRTTPAPPRAPPAGIAITRIPEGTGSPATGEPAARGAAEAGGVGDDHLHTFVILMVLALMACGACCVLAALQRKKRREDDAETVFYTPWDDIYASEGGTASMVSQDDGGGGGGGDTRTGRDAAAPTADTPATTPALATPPPETPALARPLLAAGDSFAGADEAPSPSPQLQLGGSDAGGAVAGSVAGAAAKPPQSGPVQLSVEREPPVKAAGPLTRRTSVGGGSSIGLGPIATEFASFVASQSGSFAAAGDAPPMARRTSSRMSVATPKRVTTPAAVSPVGVGEIELVEAPLSSVAVSDPPYVANPYPTASTSPPLARVPSMGRGRGTAWGPLQNIKRAVT